MKGIDLRDNEILLLNEKIVKLERELSKVNYLLKVACKKNELSAIIDDLTGAYSRHHLTMKFKESINISKRLGYNVSLCMINFDGLSQVNTLYGYDEGDKVLTDFVEVSKKFTREEFDSIFRLKGDNFLFLMTDCKIKDAIHVCERITSEIENVSANSSFSFGVVEVNEKNIILLENYMNAANDIMIKEKIIKRNQSN